MKSRSRFRSMAGFTMIELMIVVVIVTIATSMATPGLQKAYERMKYRAAVRNVTSTLRLARSTALTIKQQVGIQFDDATKTMTVFTDYVNPTAYAFETGDSILSVDTLPKEVVWMGTDCANNTLAFEPNGSCGFTGGGNLYSLAYTTDMVAFHSTNVLAATGRVATNYSFY